MARSQIGEFMPELPEVETVVRTLERQLNDATITDIEIRYDKVIDNISPLLFKEKLIGASFNEYLRRGKYLHFVMNNKNDIFHLYVHLRMEGKFYIYSNYEDTKNKHIHLVFTLEDGRYLCYHDTRKFGRFYISDDDNLSNVNKLGYEPFDETLNSEIIFEMFKKYRNDIKSFLLDQENICGIGNIYANEICYAMKVYPGLPTKELTYDDAINCLNATRTILSKAIEMGGTTIRSYTSSLGVTGRFQLNVKVQSRENEPCANCGESIKKIMLHQRGTYFCPVCQKRGIE